MGAAILNSSFAPTNVDSTLLLLRLQNPNDKHPIKVLTQEIAAVCHSIFSNDIKQVVTGPYAEREAAIAAEVVSVPTSAE